VPVFRLYQAVATYLLVAIGLACTSGCLATRVKWAEPEYIAPLKPGWITSTPALDATERLYATAIDQEEKCLASCVDLFFEVALATSHHDRHTCRRCRKRDLHKSALMKLVVTGQRFDRLDPRNGLTIFRQGHEASIPITYRGFVWQADDFHFLSPVGDYRTNAFRNTHWRAGVGVPLVVTRCGKEEGTFLPDRSVFAATLRLGCGNNANEGSDWATHCQLEMYDPLRIDRALTSDGPQCIAKDLGASLAFRLRDENRTILNNFIDPDSAGSDYRLYTIEPYQSGKIPVVFIHGLLSDPFTWVEMVNELRAQPGFVDHFQIWVFEYPTGQAFLSSAARLREQLATSRRTFDPLYQDPQLCNMVLVGHSMGGLVAKLQVTSSGHQLWRSVANRSLQEVVTSSEYRQQLAAAFYFRPSPCVSRVVFIGTPHRGSAFATRFVGRIGSSLVSVSDDREQDYENLMRCNPGVFSDEVSRRIPTSIDLLEPESKLLQAIAGLPASCRVRMHSVIGNHCRTLMHGWSDGVVPVQSARESRAITERFVDTVHTKTKSHPESIQEVLSILGQHLEESDRSLVRPVSLDLAADGSNSRRSTNTARR